MIIQIPKSLEEDFINFLDVAQSSFTDEAVNGMTKREQDVLKFVVKLIKEPSKRFATREERLEVVEKFQAIF